MPPLPMPPLSTPSVASSSPARRYLSLWLPLLPTDRLHRRAARSSLGRLPLDVPLALVTRSEGAMRLAASNAAARAQGITPGTALAQAQAMLPDLVVQTHDPAADTRLLEDIADWADRYTPLVGRNVPDGLMLDITGAAHLHGGEAALQADLVARLDRQGFTVRSAIAPTPGAAFALARHGKAGAVVADDGLRAALAPLPIAGLRLDSRTVAGLSRSGLKTIGDLMTRPRSPLTARFGALLLHRLDQALGIDAEAISPRRPVSPAEVELRLVEPIMREEDVSEAARRLAVSLCTLLEDRGEGARQVVLTVFRVDGGVRRLEVGSAEPCADPKTLHELIALRLGNLDDSLDAGYGFDLVRLAAIATGKRTAEALALPGAGAAKPDAAARLVSRLADRLAARFGAEQVMTVSIADAHQPEQAAVLVARGDWSTRGGRLPAGEPPRTCKGSRAGASLAPFEVDFEGTGPLRPLRLFEPPEPVEIMAMVPDGPPLRLRWRRRSLGITAAEGPERIAASWWVAGLPKGPSEARDYYRVVDETGRRLWIFRDGLFGGARAPRWYVHGLFA